MIEHGVSGFLADVGDVGKAAKDWPQLNFIIYHSGFRYTGGGQIAIEAGDEVRKRHEKVTGRVLALERTLEDTLPYVFAL